jgi:hypothetical protein
MKSGKKRWGGQATYRRDEKCGTNVMANSEKKRNLGRGGRR